MLFNNFKIAQFKNNKLYNYVANNQKYAPLLFFVGGFFWDWLTLGRVDRLYDMILLSTYFLLLTFCIILFNGNGFFESKYRLYRKYRDYFPLAIQFFLGGLTSAYVIYFSRSVSLSKTASFFVILVLLFFANEIFKKRISNLFVQLGIYSFVSYTFFAYMIPVLVAKMNSLVFLLSGLISLTITILLIISVYKINSELILEISKMKLLTLVFSVYALMTSFYFLKLIPPVPLALNNTIVAYDLIKENNSYKVTFEKNDWYVFWRDHNTMVNIHDTDKIFVFTSIFAPTDLNKKVYHQWKKYNSKTETLEMTDKIGFTITGGRKNGFRGYTFKQNITEGDWEVEVITEEGLIIGVVDFTLKNKPNQSKNTGTLTF